MQRKNSILMPLKSTARNIFQRKMFTGNRNYFRGRNGIAMIMAIVVIVVISTIMALSISLSTQTSKRTTDIYLYEQAVLYSKSAAELALLDIAQNPPCSVTAKNISFDNTYDANITMKYIYTSPSPCSNANDNYFSITTPEQNGSVMMDITVSTDAGTEPITYFRRTIQKL